MALEKYPLADGRLYTKGEIREELRIRQERGYRTMSMPEVPDEELERHGKTMRGAWQAKQRRNVRRHRTA